MRHPMLLIPIILWWADRPMRFTAGRARTVAGGMMIAIMVASATGAQTLVAEERYARESTTASSGDRGPAVASGVILLREGSRIPPTPGRVVLMGRRWVFLAGPSVAAKNSIQADDRDQAASDFDPTEVRRLFGSVAFTSTSDSSASGGSVDREPGNRHSVQLVLAENLNLQRIIEALRSDPADENWILTGQISEFFGENRLMILTAQRSNRD